MEVHETLEEFNGKDTENNGSAHQISLSTLNADCVIHIFQYLDLYDCINLAESCTRMWKIADAEVYHRKFQELKLDHKMINGVKMSIDRVLSHVGQHVRSFSIHQSLNMKDEPDLSRRCICIDIVLIKAKKKCKNIKYLTIDGWICSVIPSLVDLKALKSLTLNRCNFRHQGDIFKDMHNLKNIRILNSYEISKDELMLCFKNNPDIESFVLDDRYPYLESYDRYEPIECLKMLPKLERLSLRIDHDRNCQCLRPLLQLKRLAKLRLDCVGNDLGEFLIKLAAKGNIQELEMLNVRLNSEALGQLQFFEKLQLLVVKGYNLTTLNSISVWPPNLKHLQLENFEVTSNTCMALINGNKFLENINLFHCYTAKNECAFFGNVKNIFDKIMEIQQKNYFYGQRILTLTLPSFCYTKCQKQSKNKYLFTSNWLRLVNREYVGLHGISTDLVSIGINFLDISVEQK